MTMTSLACPTPSRVPQVRPSSLGDTFRLTMSGDKDKPLPTDKPLPALPDDARPMTAGAAGATPQVPINDPNFKFLGSEVASNNPSVRYRKRDKLKAFFKFNNPFAKKEDNSDLFVNTLANPVTTPVKGNENQPINRDGLTALPPMPSWAYGDPPSPSTATMPSSERSATSKKHLFNKGKGAE